MNTKIFQFIAVILLVIAAGLMAAGMYVLYFVGHEIYTTYLDIGGNNLLMTLTEQLNSQSLLTDYTGSAYAILDQGGAQLIALFILILFFLIGLSVGSLLISTGLKIVLSLPSFGTPTKQKQAAPLAPNNPTATVPQSASSVIQDFNPK